MIKQHLSKTIEAPHQPSTAPAPIGTKGTIGDGRTRHLSHPQPYSGSTVLNSGDQNMSTSVDSNGGHYSVFGGSNNHSGGGGLLSSSLRSFQTNSMNTMFQNKPTSAAASGSLLFQSNQVALDKRKTFDNDAVATDIRIRHNSGPFHPNAQPAVNGFAHTASLPLPIGILLFLFFEFYLINNGLSKLCYL